jgi:hypothetical protein
MKQIFITGLTIFFFWAPLSAGAISIDLLSDFPNVQGENGFYALAYDFQAGSYRPLDSEGNYRFNTPGQSVPLVAREAFLDDYIGLHPAVQSAKLYPPEDAVLAWVAPFTDTYRLQGDFRLAAPLGSGTDGINYYIKSDNMLLLSGHLGAASSATYDVMVDLQKDQWLYYGVNAGRTESTDWGNVRGTISATPIPGAVWLMGSGLLGLGLLRKFKGQRTIISFSNRKAGP